MAKKIKAYMKISLGSVLLFLTTGSAHAMSNTDKFEWLATESAPKHYPMEIIQGTFYYHGENSGLYIPYGGTLKKGWGQGISDHLVGEKFKPLPDRLKIVYFSYAEKQFYKGEFDLPYDKILALFRDGVEHPTDFGNGQTRPVYSYMMAGIAPGGAVAVWVAGKKQHEVFFGQAEKINLNPVEAFKVPFKDQQDADKFMEDGLVEALSPEELASLKKDGIPFDLWTRYRNRYDWIPTFTTKQIPEYIDPSYLNGEYFGQWILAEKQEPNVLRPVPSKLSFRSVDRTLYEITFDEFEIMGAFEKLGANGKKIYLEFEPRLPRTQIKARLYNDKESIELKKFVSADW